MSRLEELIAELCPDGVEYKPLHEVAKIQRGVRVVRSQLSSEGKYPVFQNSLTPLGYHSEMNCEAETTFVICAGAAGDVGYSNVDFWAADDCQYCKSTEKLLSRYLYHVLLWQQTYLYSQVRRGSIPRLSRTVLEKIKIPIPPLPVQREIIKILDNFTELTAELTAELTTRQKQYDYYRDLLLSTHYDDSITVKMGDVLTFINGRAYKQPELLDSGKYPVLRVGNFYTNSSWYYSDLELDDEKYCDNGDLLYSWAATLGPRIWDGSKCIFHYHIWKIVFDETRISKKYLYYFLQYDLAKISKSITQSTMIHVSMGSMKERELILPPIEEQERIASLIERFDLLCSDINTGLPAELTARQRQYEYYRDKLLSFEERTTKA